MDINQLSYRPGVGVVLINEKNEVFVGQRIDNLSGGWQMPQGGIDGDETPEAAVQRELAEEIGTDKFKIFAKTRRWYSYELPAHLIPKLWNGQYRGQKQIWFLVRFLGENEDINLEAYTPEFRDWKWVNKEELLDLIAPFKRSLYFSVLSELWTYITQEDLS